MIANLNYSPFKKGRVTRTIMKTIFSSISRLIVSYSKFGVMIVSLTLMNSTVKADGDFTYLSLNSQFLKLSCVYIQENQNIRTRKLINQFIRKEEELI